MSDSILRSNSSQGFGGDSLCRNVSFAFDYLLPVAVSHPVFISGALVATTPTPLMNEIHVALLRVLLPKEVATVTEINLQIGETLHSLCQHRQHYLQSVIFKRDTLLNTLMQGHRGNRH